MKKLFALALLAFLSVSLSAQGTSADWKFGTLSDFNVDMSERCLVFSSLDYRTMSVFDNDGELLQRVNLRRVARHQTSSLVFVCFDGWEDGRYTVTLENRGVRKSADMVKDGDRVIIITEK